MEAELNEIRRLLAAMSGDDDGEDWEKMDMNAEVLIIYSDTDGKHKDLPPLKPRCLANEILSRGTLGEAMEMAEHPACGEKR